MSSSYQTPQLSQILRSSQHGSPLSEPSQHQSFSLKLTSSFLSNVLGINFLYLLISALAFPIHSILLILSSTGCFWLMLFHKSPSTSKNSPSEPCLSYPIISSLVVTFLSVLFAEGEVSKTSAIYTLVFSGLSGLLLVLASMYKNLCQVQGENHVPEVDSLKVERDQAVKNAEEQKLISTMLTHESRNVLNCLVNSLNFLEVDLNPINFNMENVKKSLLGAKYCCDTLINYFNNYLSNCKSIGSQQEITCLPQVFHRAEEIASSAMKFKGLQAKFTLAETVPKSVMLNEASLLQILLNLVYNAIKFTDNGSIHVSVDWQNEPLNSIILENKGSYCKQKSDVDVENLDCLSTKSADDSILNTSIMQTKRTNQCQAPDNNKGKLIIKVSDTGCGMSENDLAILFEPYSQPNSDPAKRKQGSGLGLWLTKMIVSNLGGHIKVESQPKKGTTFIVSLDCYSPVPEGKHEAKRNLFGQLADSNTDPKAVILGENSVENLVITAYLKTLGIEDVYQTPDLKGLWKFLDNHVEQESVVVLHDKYTEGLNGLYRWEKRLLNKKTILIIEDPIQDIKSECIFSNLTRLERPVKFNDFSKALAGSTSILKGRDSVKSN